MNFFSSLRNLSGRASGADVLGLRKEQPGPEREVPGILLDRHGFEQAVAEAVRSANIDGRSFAVLQLELDNLFLIQDGFGDLVKDEVVRHVAVRLLQIAGKEGKVAFYTDGKFLTLVRDKGGIDQQLAQRTLAAIAQHIEINAHRHRSSTPTSLPYSLLPPCTPPSSGQARES